MSLRQFATDAALAAALREAEKPVRVQHEWRGQEVDWVFLMKALPHGALAYGIDQSAKRSRAANRARLARGCKPGVADSYILWNGVTLWIERKKPKGGRLEEAQETFRDQVLANGGHWVLARSTDDVEAACRAAGIPLRATLGGIRERIKAQNERLPVRKKATRKGKAEPRYEAGKRFTAKWNAP